MKIVHGKRVYETLTEIVNPAHTAVVVIDMQNDFCRADGAWPSQMRVDISMFDSTIDRLSRFVAAARDAGCLIVHTQHTMAPDLSSESAPRLAYRLGGNDGRSDTSWPSDFGYALDGTWGQQFIDELTPLPGEPVIKKYRSSAFFETNLGGVLRAAQVDSLIITGCITDGCVLATGQHASFLDYYTVVVPDCVATWNTGRHEFALSLMPTKASSDIVHAWKA